MVYIVSEGYEITKLENYCKKKAISDRECVILYNRSLSKNTARNLFRPGAVIMHILWTPFFLVLKEYDYSIVHQRGEIIAQSDSLVEMYMLVSVLKRNAPDYVTDMFRLGIFENDVCGHLGSIIGKLGYDFRRVCLDVREIKDRGEYY